MSNYKTFTLNADQYSYLDRLVKKQTYVSQDKLLKIKNNIKKVYPPTRELYAIFTLVIDDETPIEWWKENIPLDFIIDKLD